MPATAIRFWLNASSPLPDDIFLKIVDLLLDRSLSELYPPSPARPSQPKTDS